MIVQQQRVVLPWHRIKIPTRLLQETVVLRVHPQLPIERDVHAALNAAELKQLPITQSKLLSKRHVIAVVGAVHPRRPEEHVSQVLASHHVRVEVVVHDRRVLIRARNPEDVELGRGSLLGFIPKPQIRPQAGRFNQDLKALNDQKVRVPCHPHVLVNRVRDVGVDVVLRGPRRIVGGRFFAADGAPRKQRPLLAHGGSALAGRIQ